MFASPTNYQWGLGADSHCTVCTKLPRVVMIVQEGAVMGVFLKVTISPHHSYNPYFTRTARTPACVAHAVLRDPFFAQSFKTLAG